MNTHKGFTTWLIVGIAALVLVVGAVVYVASSPNSNGDTSAVTGNEFPVEAQLPVSGTSSVSSTLQSPGTPSGSTTIIKVPLINETGQTTGQLGPYGCGTYLTLVDRPVPATTAVLNAVYQWIFSQPASFDGGNYTNIAAGYSQLDFSSVSLTNGVARVYLTGTMMGPGHCAEPALAAQIEQAAFQYPTVSSIEVYLNGQLFDWCTISDAPDEGFCAQGPRYWVKNK